MQSIVCNNEDVIREYQRRQNEIDNLKQEVGVYAETKGVAISVIVQSNLL